MGHWWDDEHTLWLVTPEEFERLPDGFVLTSINDTTATKGKDHIDMDTRFGHIAYGASKAAIDTALNGAGNE